MNLNRRNFLSSLPFIGLGLYNRMPNSGFRVSTSITDFDQEIVPIISDNVHNVYEDYGADPNGSNDSTVHIQNAVNAAQNAGGGIVWFPPGKYKVTSPIEITKQVILSGVGCNPGTFEGSWLYLSDPSGGSNPNLLPHPIWIHTQFARGTSIQNLGFFYPQQALINGNFKTFGYTIAVEADDVLLQNLHLHNSYKGILLQNLNQGEGTVGRIVLDHITGQPLSNGIFVDTAQDSVKINNIHFWPYWAQTQDIINWIYNNGVAIKSKRNDNPHFSNIFAFGYKYGMEFIGTGSQVTSKFRVTNADMDYCAVGLEINGAGTTGQVANFTAQGRNPGGGLVGIRASTSNIKLQGSNIFVKDYSANGIRAEGSGTKIMLENVWVQNWNMSGSGFPGIEATVGAEIKLGFGTWFENSNNASNIGGNVLIDN